VRHGADPGVALADVLGVPFEDFRVRTARMFPKSSRETSVDGTANGASV
jgi:hypothetical protein